MSAGSALYSAVRGGRRRRGLFCLGLVSAMLVTAVMGGEGTFKARPLPEARWDKLPRWRGFNLLEKFHKSRGNRPFVEDDFRWIAEFGFNFVRLPMDYRLWIKDGDWNRFDEKTLKEIDQAVAFGRKSGVHVSICFHRAPGYTVAKPPEKTSLWTDAETQKVCAKHWAAFARRYKGIPSSEISFNLMNEPGHVEPEGYVKVAKILADAIRKEDPDRLIISDGLRFKPLPELAELRVAQAMRGYAPSEISHYKASWIYEPERMPPPEWPRLLTNGILIGPRKHNRPKSLRIDGPFEKACKVRLKIGRGSGSPRLQVTGDGKALFEKQFNTGENDPDAAKVEKVQGWRSTYDRDYTFDVPADTKRIEATVLLGGWLTVRQVGITPEGREREDVQHLQTRTAWNREATPLRYVFGASGKRFTAAAMEDRDWLWKEVMRPWVDLHAKGTGVMVGECGAFRHTPHKVVLRWLEDNLKNYKRAGFGWALWNFRGGFGILDSDRDDVEYEAFRGHKLDRKMLTLLQKY